MSSRWLNLPSDEWARCSVVWVFAGILGSLREDLSCWYKKNGPAAGRLSAVRSGYVGYCLSCRPVRISFFRPGAVESGSVQAGQIAVSTGVSYEDDLEDQRGVAGYAGRSR